LAPGSNAQRQKQDAFLKPSMEFQPKGGGYFSFAWSTGKAGRRFAYRLPPLGTGQSSPRTERRLLLTG
jgi:hypothetical protein